MNNLDMFINVAIALLGLIVGAIAMLIYKSGKGVSKKLEDNSEKEGAQKAANAFPKEDLNKFMEFDKIEDDMIVQDNGDKYVMVIKCQGINYDLMSETEMLAVEEGFSNFLNTLKYPIQLYVQSRSLNLEEEIKKYKERLVTIKEDYDKAELQAYTRKKNEKLTQKERDAIDYEVKKKRVMVDYGADIISYVEKMSLNKNILQRRYYIVVSYYTSELGLATNFTKEDAHSLAYAELYNRCRSIAGALVPCGIETKILNSEELAELLYIAYNKDDADIYNIRKALNSGFYRLYSTAQDVIEKKRIAIDNAVKEKAIAEAELALKKSMDRLKENSQLTYEQELSDAAKRQAMQLILDNSEQFEGDVVDGALNDLNSQMYDPLIPEYEMNEMMAQDGENKSFESSYASNLEEKEKALEAAKREAEEKAKEEAMKNNIISDDNIG